MERENQCVLCLNNDFICVSDVLLYEKIEKYLKIKIGDDPTNMCTICIETIETFHEFYERIQSLHALTPRVSLLKTMSTKNISNVPVSAENSKQECDKTTIEDITKFFSSYQEVLSNGETLKCLRNQPVLRNEETVKFGAADACIKISKGDIDHVLSDENMDEPLDETHKPAVKKPRVARRKIIPFLKKKRMSKTVVKVQAVEQQLEEYYKDISCSLCRNNVTWGNLKELDRHFKEYHEEKSFILCCKKRFTLEDKFRLRRHLNIHLNPDSCRCDICGKTLSTPRHMRIHKQLHIPEPERNYECEKCGKKCGGSAELYRHKHSIHSQQHAVCDICGKEFRKRVSFRAHMKQVHEEAGKTYVCLECAKTYRSFASLRQHRNIAHSENYAPKTRQCPECGKWVGAMYLKKHMLRIHNDGKAYECPMCERVFKLPADVRSHLVTHSDDRPFLCSECGSGFKTKATLKHHFIQHTGGNPVKCPICGKMISNHTNYRAHMKRMHRSKPYECEEDYNRDRDAPDSCDVQCEETVTTDKADLYCNENSNNLE